MVANHQGRENQGRVILGGRGAVDRPATGEVRSCDPFRPSWVHGKWSLVHDIAMRSVAALSEITMRCLRIYATPDGDSHFEEIDIPNERLPSR
jgi:hypothetical protein